MLPNENNVADEISHRFGVLISAMNDVHDVTVGLANLAVEQAKPPTFVDTIVKFAYTTLYVKACKQFRSVLVLCNQGLTEDADTIVRTLFETSLNFSFVLSPQFEFRKAGRKWGVIMNSMDRGLRSRLYVAHTAFEYVKLVRLLAQDDSARDDLQISDDRLQKIFDNHASGIGVNWTERIQGKNTCAGLSVRDLAENLNMLELYSWIYRVNSLVIHSKDIFSHAGLCEIDETTSARLSPKCDNVPRVLHSTLLCVWPCIKLLNKELGLRQEPLIETRVQRFSELLQNLQ